MTKCDHCNREYDPDNEGHTHDSDCECWICDPEHPDFDGPGKAVQEYAVLHVELNLCCPECEMNFCKEVVMRKDEINRTLAEIIGWRDLKWDEGCDTKDNYWPPGFYGTSPSGEEHALCSFNPMENIAQTFEVLTKFDSWELFKTDNGEYGCNIFNPEMSFSGYCETPKAAICLAAIAAKGE